MWESAPMNVLIVYAHLEATSFVAAMKNVAVEVLQGQGHTVVVSDLYGVGFNAAAEKYDFVSTTGEHFNYMNEQKHAATLQMSFAPDIVGEIQKLLAADVILFVAPVWWFSVPAIMKGWFDRVLAMGVAWDKGRLYETGLLRGKQAMMIMSAGGSHDSYRAEGKHRATPIQMLHPINHGTLAFCGMDVHEPFVSLSTKSVDDTERARQLEELKFRLTHLFDSPSWLIRYQ